MINHPSQPKEMRGVALPEGAADVLLPSSAMAEVISFQAPAPHPGAPNWLLGMVSWRGCSVPLVSLTAADTEPTEGVGKQRARIVICYTPSGNSALPYLGIYTIGLPRLTRLSAEALEPQPNPQSNPFVLHWLTIAGRAACIPDMDAVERSVLDVIQS